MKLCCILVIAFSSVPWCCSASPANPGLLLAGGSGRVLVFDLPTGTQRPPLVAPAGTDYLHDFALGPDGHLYVLDCHYLRTNRVLRFNSVTGAFMGIYREFGPEAWDGGIAFDQHGDLYILCDWNTVRRYNGQSGAYVGDVLSFPGLELYSISFGPDGLLYTTGGSWGNGAAFIFRSRCDGSGLEFFPSGECPAPGGWDCGTPNGPRKPVWGPDGNLYSANLNDGIVRRHHGISGELLGTFADPPGAGHVGLAFGGDAVLYVSAVWEENSAIYRVSASTGQTLGTLATNVSAAALLALLPPEIDSQPRNVIACEGATVTLRCGVRTNGMAAAFQWMHEGVPVPTGLSPVLTIPEVGRQHTGTYTLRATNLAGSVTSTVATVSVSSRPSLAIGFYPYGVTLGLQNAPPGIYGIDYSTNLSEWSRVDTILTTLGKASGTSLQPTNSVQGFYRARLLP